MAHQPGNQMPIVPQRRPGWLADVVGEWVKGLVRLAYWVVVALVTAAVVFLAFRAVIFGCRTVLQAIGV